MYPVWVKAVFYCGVGETAFSMSCNGNRLTAYVVKQFNNFRIVPTDRLQIRNQAVEFRNCHFFHFLYLPKFIYLSAGRKQRFNGDFVKELFGGDFFRNRYAKPYNGKNTTALTK